MSRYAQLLGSHSYQTLSAIAVCPSLDIFTAPTPGRITTQLSRLASQAANLSVGDGGSVVQGHRYNYTIHLFCTVSETQ